MSDEKLIKAVSKLIRLTQEKKLKWEKMNPPSDLFEGTDSVVPYFYGVRHKENNLGLYEIRFKAVDPNTENIYWADDVVLSVFAEDWTRVWDFPEKSAVYDLLRSIRYQIADVDGLIDSLLNDAD